MRKIDFSVLSRFLKIQRSRRQTFRSDFVVIKASNVDSVVVAVVVVSIVADNAILTSRKATDHLLAIVVIGFIILLL
jgi:hypothetical protein